VLGAFERQHVGQSDIIRPTAVDSLNHRRVQPVIATPSVAYRRVFRSPGSFGGVD
jgi:hypothetical protein